MDSALFETDANLRYFSSRSAKGSSQASHNIALLLLERYRGRKTVPEGVVVAVLEYATLALVQLDAGADLSSARVIREGSLSKVLDLFPPRAALPELETVRKRVSTICVCVWGGRLCWGCASLTTGAQDC